MTDSKKRTTTTPNTELITVRLPHELTRQIKSFTAITGASRSALLVEGVQMAMQRRQEAAQSAVGAK